MGNQCSWCKYFRSYQDIYDDDLEPWNFGECSKDGKTVEGVDYDNSCPQFEES